MLNRITIMLDDQVQKKLRDIQAQRIKVEVKSVSFSKVLNDELRKLYKMKK